jgi:hypothetical protein
MIIKYMLFHLWSPESGISLYEKPYRVLLPQKALSSNLKNRKFPTPHLPPPATPARSHPVSVLVEVAVQTIAIGILYGSSV